MTLRDKATARARGRLEAQTGANERVLHSATIGHMGMVLTTRRLMLAPPIKGSEPELNLPLSAIQDVAWKKGPFGTSGQLTIYTSSQTLQYKVLNKQGEPAAVRIRQAIAGID